MKLHVSPLHADLNEATGGASTLPTATVRLYMALTTSSSHAVNETV